MDLTHSHFGDEIAVLKAQLNAARAKNPDADLSGLENAIDALSRKHTQKLTEGYNENAPKPSSSDPMGPKTLASDAPPVLPFSTPENTPRITPQNVSIPLGDSDPNPYPFPNKAAGLPDQSDQTPTHNTIVTTAPNTVDEKPV